MSDWPDNAPPTLIVSMYTRECAGVSSSLAAAASTAWPLANLALFQPFALARPTTFVMMAVDNGASVSGNIDVGIYDWAGTRIVSSGSTAQAGTNALQTFNITDTLLGPGRFYLACVLDNNTGTLMRVTPTVGFNNQTGITEMTSAFPLPATATFASSTRAYQPHVAASTKTVV